MSDERIDDYLDGLDALAALDALLPAVPPSFDEWQAMRLAAGQGEGTFTEYLEAIKNFGFFEETS